MKQEPISRRAATADVREEIFRSRAGEDAKRAAAATARSVRRR